MIVECLPPVVTILMAKLAKIMDMDVLVKVPQ